MRYMAMLVRVVDVGVNEEGAVVMNFDSGDMLTATADRVTDLPSPQQLVSESNWEERDE